MFISPSLLSMYWVWRGENTSPSMKCCLWGSVYSGKGFFGGLLRINSLWHLSVGCSFCIIFWGFFMWKVVAQAMISAVWASQKSILGRAFVFFLRDLKKNRFYCDVTFKKRRFAEVIFYIMYYLMKYILLTMQYLSIIYLFPLFIVVFFNVLML